MSLTATRQAEEILRDSLKELESAKGSVLTGVQKLNRAAKLLGKEDISILNLQNSARYEKVAFTEFKSL